MEVGIVGIIGIIIGVIITEFLRRQNRIESYSRMIFDRRLHIYEELYKRLQTGSPIASDLINNPKYSEDDRLKIVGHFLHDMISFCDDNQFYLNEDISVHCAALFMGIEDIYDISDPKVKQERIDNFYDNFKMAKMMIRKESGLTDIDKLFRSITKAQHKSAVIDYLNELRRKEIDSK